MAMYYGDSNGKAQQIVVTGMQGPAGPQGPQGEPGPGWEQVTAFSNNYYQLWESGSMRMLTPKITANISFSSPSPMLNLAGLWSSLYTQSLGTLPEGHIPSVSFAATLYNYFNYNNRIDRFINGAVTVDNTGSITLNATELTSDNSTYSVQATLPVIQFVVSQAAI